MIDRVFFPTLILSLGALTVLIAGEALWGLPSGRAAPVELPRVVITAPHGPVVAEAAGAAGVETGVR